MSVAETLVPIALVFLVLQSPLVLCAGWFAPIVGAKRWLWIGLTAIPWLGMIFGYVLIFKAFGNLLDALERRNQLQSEQHLENRLNPYPKSRLSVEPEQSPTEGAAFPRQLIG